MATRTFRQSMEATHARLVPSGLLRPSLAGTLLGVSARFVAFGSTDVLKPEGAASWLDVAATRGSIAILGGC